MTTLFIFVIVATATILGLVVRYAFKHRQRHNSAWEGHLTRNASTNSLYTGAAAKNDGHALHDYSKNPAPWLVPVSTPAAGPSQPVRTPKDSDLRRSSRIELPVSLTVIGTNRRGEAFQDKTSAVSVNLHGCRYISHHDYPLEGWVTMQVTGTDGRNSPAVRARVRSVVTPKSPLELFQVGVELETPANVWGIPAPEDWRRILATNNMSSGAATAVAPALEPTVPSSPFRQTTSAERRAEVTVFPSPAASTAVKDEEKTADALNAEGMALSPEQLLPALQDKVQQVADYAMQQVIETRVEESVRNALTRIDDHLKANVRQSEESSAARLTEVQERWQKELMSYGNRAEEIALRMEILASKTEQGVTELQNYVERIKQEFEPRLQSRVSQVLALAKNEFETRAAQISERHLTQLAETSQIAAREARSQLDEHIAEVRSLLLATSRNGVSEERLESLVNSTHERTLNHLEERLAEMQGQMVAKRETVRESAEEFAEQFERLNAELRQMRSQLDLSMVEVRALQAKPTDGLLPEHLESVMQAAKDQILKHVEGRVNEIAGRSEQQHDLTRQHAEEVARRVENLKAETHEVSEQQEQRISELRTQFAAAISGISQEHLDGALKAAREQLFSHLEWRLGEVSGVFDREHRAARLRSEEMAQRLDQFAGDTRRQLEESKKLAEQSAREPQPQQIVALTASVDQAAKEFETAAARISDRQLVRMTEQKQSVAREVSLELEARASETRVHLEKAANGMLDEFRRRAEVQIDLIVSEATERVASYLASFDAEHRAACEARRRTLESEVARTAEQSTMEFRSTMKAFLYSCLVAAVGAVDEHAQATLAGIAKSPSSSAITLDAAAVSSRKNEETASAMDASAISSELRGQ